MSVDFDVVDALAGLAEDLRGEGDFVARIHAAVTAMKKERDEARAEVAAAYQRGAKAMRKIATKWLDDRGAMLDADDIGALPIPEDKP